jgi:hypothetical protein
VGSHHSATPATARVNRRRNVDRSGGLIGDEITEASPNAQAAAAARRQYLVAHLCDCGPRPVLEALIAVDAGTPLHEVLEDFGRLPPALYRAMGADVLPIHRFVVVRRRLA